MRYLVSESRDPVEVTVWMTDDSGSDPDEIQVDVCRPVCLTIENTGEGPHDFTIDEILITTEPGEVPSERTEFELHQPVGGGASSMLEFTPQEAGIYGIRCAECEKAGKEMVGTLVVI